MANKKDAGSMNYVHQTAILCETIKKEQKNQKIYKNYSINPFKKSMYFYILYITTVFLSFHIYLYIFCCLAVPVLCAVRDFCNVTFLFWFDRNHLSRPQTPNRRSQQTLPSILALLLSVEAKCIIFL